MALSNTVRASSHRCLRCIAANRHYNTESTSTPATVVSREENRNSDKISVVAQLRSITMSQLQALNQFSKFIVKSAYEQGLKAAVNKEWIRTVQKFPTEQNNDNPSEQSVESSSTLAISSSDIKTENNKPESIQMSYSNPQVINNLKQNFSTTAKQNSEAVPVNVIPQWKMVKPNVVAKDVIEQRTKSLLKTMAATDDEQSRRKRLDDLFRHFDQYPQAKSLAVKDGTITALLRISRAVKDYDTHCLLRELLAILGHVKPLSGRGIRILAMDGGGTRGVVVIELLRRLEELTGRRVCELFDFICGVSTGAILAMLFGPHKKNLDDCSALYKEISAKIFNQSAFWGTGNLLWSHSYYDTALWEKLLQTHIGDMQLIKTARDDKCPKVAAVSAAVNLARVRPFVFRNYELPVGVPSLYRGTSRAALWEAVRASAAAPSYFEEFKLGDVLHQDGGILVNNPTAIAIHEAKMLWPGEKLHCVVSFGTGRNHSIEAAAQTGNFTNGDSYSSWTTKFSKILDSATDTEAVHTMLHDLLPDDVYFRFNPYLNEVANMSETRPEKLEQLEQDATMYARRNEDKFQQVAATLTQPRSYTQMAQDWLLNKKTVVIDNSF